MRLRFILRDIMHSRGQAVIFVLCVALSLVSMVAINSFRRDIQAVMQGDARNLQGGDIIVRSHSGVSPDLLRTLMKLRTEAKVAVTESWEFYSMARRADGERAIFSSIRAVEDGYPLYGRVELRSGRSLHEVLTSGKAVVATMLLERLGLRIGDRLRLGNAELQIVDVVERESLRPAELFNFGPRIFVALADVPKMDLVGKGSRASHEFMVQVYDAGQVNALFETIKTACQEQEQVLTAANAGSRLKRFFDNLLFFLSLLSIFTLLLAGMGIQSALTALLRRKVTTIAVLRALGATSHYLLLHYLAVVFLLGTLGCGVGIGLGLILKKSFLVLLSGLLPEHLTLGVTLADVIEGLFIGFCTISFFTVLPLSMLGDIKPSAIFRKEPRQVLRRHRTRLLLVLGLGLIGALVVRQLGDIRISLYCLGGMVSLVAISGLFLKGVQSALARLSFKNLALRQAVRSLLRPGNASWSITVTLASALAVLFAIYLLEFNLRAAFIEAYPADAPNLYCLDIQKDQQQGFTDLVGGQVELYPVVRARLKAINGVAVSREEEMKRRGDSLAREFSLTYRRQLLADEVITEGDGLFGKEHRVSALPPVSILDTVAEMGKIKVGDILEFGIQGVPLRAEVTSIRSRTRSMLFPYFYFVFPEDVLKNAPQTAFAALHVGKAQMAGTQNKIVAAFPNISPIDVSESALELGRLMDKLAILVTFFASFALLAGALILISSVLATRMARIEEAVQYKILGADSSFVLRVFFLENLLLALQGGGAAVLVAAIGSFAVCRYYFEIPFDPKWFIGLALLAGTAAIIVALGLISSIGIIYKKPAGYLRDEG